jgi:hypothetical protein
MNMQTIKRNSTMTRGTTWETAQYERRTDRNTHGTKFTASGIKLGR